MNKFLHHCLRYDYTWSTVNMNQLLMIYSKIPLGEEYKISMSKFYHKTNCVMPNGYSKYE